MSSKWKRKVMTVVVMAAMVMCAACGNSAETTTEVGTTEITTEAVPEAVSVAENTTEEIAKTQEARTFVDQAGNTIVVPEKIEKVIITSRTPLPSVYCLYRGSAEGLIGMSPGAMSAAENSYLPKVIEGVTDVRTDFMEGTKEINIEEILAMEPDVVLCSAESPEEIALLQEAGITAVGFSTKLNNGNTIEIVNGWLEQLELLFGEANNVAGITEYANEKLEMIRERVSTLSEEEKPSVMIINGYNDGVYKVYGMNDFWINEAGGINAAAELPSTQEVSIEQIYEWNPEIILITNFTTLLPEDLLNNVLEGADWSHVTAVQEGTVYKFPLGMYRWCPPSSDAALSIQWVATKLQPELFSDIDLDQEIKNYYKRFYGADLSDEDLQEIYNPSRAAADY